MKSFLVAIARLRARVRWNQDYADVALGLVLAGFVVVTLVKDQRTVTPPAALLLAMQTLPICFRRRNPIRVLEITGGAIVLYGALGYVDANGWTGVFAAFYTVAANEPRERAAVAAAVTVVGIAATFVAYGVFDRLSNWPINLTINFALFAVAWLIGDNLRVRRAYTRELEERAARLEREREDKAAAAIGEERARIARELHDIVAHYVSVAVVQASGARRVLDRDPAAARDALEAVEVAGRTALTEMRRMLEVLRTDDSGLGPQPGLAELDRLVQRVREAGVPVTLTIAGNVTALPAGVDLAAYRIVQEALTNVVKHAGKANASVAVRRTGDAVEIEVADDGRGAAAPSLAGTDGGHGLIGMRERVSLFGGTVQAGPVPPRGWRVLAKLPLEAEPPVRSTSRAGRDGEDAHGAARAGSGAARGDHVDRTGSGDGEIVAPRVVPPIIGRVIPPRPARAATPERGIRERGGDL